ncbi:hypothetical protein CI15_34445 [Paraburkholderia monticola]|uniref:Uncharacterized protein n=1 Tax=Paraburkholderia monticola TaxID=1399968 RepID=A0A149PC78_9BURK|nr:hypothetical protein [Paraburkholderia monticola]KXU82613.1 hypothetical protein CI15_34445 [Paraburkholderia monticola]
MHERSDAHPQTLREAGITPFMSEASARLQDSVVGAMEAGGIDYGTLSTPFDWRAFFDGLPDPGENS